MNRREKETRSTTPLEMKTTDISIFGRLIERGRTEMAPSLARYVLSLGFDKNDQVRMGQLAERNQLGELSTAERDELMSFVKAGHLLALLHSKARKLLKRKPAS